MSASRPKLHDNQHIKEACKRLATEIIKSSLDHDWASEEEAAEELFEVFQGTWDSDAYKLAKDLERNTGLSIDAQWVEELGCFEGFLRQAHENAMVEWAKTAEIASPEVGQIVTWTRKAAPAGGIVVRLDSSKMQAVVNFDQPRPENPNGGYVCNWEDLSPV